MTHDDIAAMLAGIGLPTAYDQFRKGEAPGAPPFICFLYPEDADFKADDSNYQRITDLTVELYVDAPDFTLEAAVETALGGAGLVYTRSGPRYIRDERMYQTTYETSVPLTDNPPAPDDPTAASTEEPPTNDTEVLEQDAEQG